MTPIGVAILVVLLLVVCLGPRRWALLAVVAGVFYTTQWQSVDLAGLNLFGLRFLEVAAFGRVVLRRELDFSKLNRLDWTLLLLYNYTAFVWIVRSGEITPLRIGYAFDPTLWFLALRGLIGTVDEFRWVLYRVVVLLVPYTALVFTERLTGRTAFGFIGHTQELYVRNGVARCQGTFRHAVLLGSVAASFLSLYIGLWMGGSRRAIATLGGVLCLGLVVLSNSGGPAMSTAAVALGWFAWRFRHRMSFVRLAALAVLVLLVIVMKAPIWYLPFKISAVIGGGGYYRGLLMERAWEHLPNWGAFGIDIRKTADWMPTVLDTIGGADVTNQYLVFGLKAGLPAILILVAVLTLGFIAIGRAVASVGDDDGAERPEALTLWGLGVTLFMHAVSWISTSYFDQSYVIWLVQLAAVSSLTHAVLLRAGERNSEAPSAVTASARHAPRRPGSLRRDTKPPSRRLARTRTQPPFRP